MEWTTISDMARPLWLVWLMIIFVGIAFWAYRPGNKERFEKDAHIIFDEEKIGGQHG